MLCVALLASALNVPSRAAIRVSHAAPAVVYHRAAVFCSEEASPSAPLLGGTPVELGDPLLCRDEESDAWWRASVRDTRENEVLVHFMGCDEAWDVWMDVRSPDISRMDSVEQKKDNNAFQSDTYETGLDDEELLAQYREERWDDNARWQLTTFAQAQVGELSLIHI